jgi:5S rRNA maturation endonuclease (ribonuclease M5)
LWEWKLGDVRRVLYRLPKLLELEEGATVYLVEGEKDVHRLEREGVVATTWCAGAGAWSQVKDHAQEVLAGMNVIVVVDNDVVGHKLCRKLQEQLTSPKSIKFVVAKSGKDASDHLNAGHGLDEFVPLRASRRAGEESTLRALTALRGGEDAASAAASMDARRWLARCSLGSEAARHSGGAAPGGPPP